MGCVQEQTIQPKDNMASTKKKAPAKTGARLKDLKSKKNPKGGQLGGVVGIRHHKPLNPQPLPP